MPRHVDQRIVSLRNLVERGLHQENLDQLVRECNALAQDSSHVLIFFVLKSVFRELSDALDTGAIELSRHQELVSRISEKTCSLLRKLERGEPIPSNDIQDLIQTHVVNLNLFRT